MGNISIRQAVDGDIEEIKDVIKEAFYRPGKDEHFNEWEFTDKVRSDPGFIPELCLVATINQEIVGYILLSRASIGEHVGLSLGPLAVKPSYQGKGVGRRLIANGLKTSTEMGFAWVALIGGDYYRQFGFEAASKHKIVLSDNHPENPYLQIKFLDSDKRVSGKMRFCDAFYNENGELL